MTKNVPIRDAKSYEAAIERATHWQSLLEKEESRILEYLRTAKKSKSGNIKPKRC